jgi:hypothetical protein
MSSQVLGHRTAVPMAVSLATQYYSGCGSEQINLYWIRSIELFVHTKKDHQKLAINVTLSLLQIHCGLTYVGTPVSRICRFFLWACFVIRQETKMFRITCFEYFDSRPKFEQT